MTNDQTTEPAEYELIVTRTLEAPRPLVFSAYSSCEYLRPWWGPRSWPMAECSLDFRVGGEWHYCLRGPNEGDESWGKAFYEEIVEPELIAYTDALADAEGNLSGAMPTTRSRVEFVDLDGRTQLTIRATYASPDALQQVLDMGMAEGLMETLDRLAEHVTAAARA